MDARQIQRVKASFAKVVPIAGTAAVLFYGRLFKLDPELEPLFKSNSSEQRVKLIKMLGMAVNGLDDLDALLLLVRSIGVRHASYGVKEQDYDIFGSALFWTLEQGLREAFILELRQAWEQAYGVLAGAMRSAGAG